MLNSLKAYNEYVEPSEIVTLVETLDLHKELYDVTLLSLGSYGLICKISLIEEMGQQIDSPFTTLTIVNDEVSRTSDKTFCCKFVPILEPSAEVTIVISGKSHRQHASTRLSFTNECNKQRQIYAFTNHNLNSICLPLFYFDIVNLSTDTMVTRFIRNVFEKTNISVTSPMVLQYGISFMPFSPNTYTTSTIPKNTPATTVFLTSELAVENIKPLIDNIYSRNPLNEPRIIEIFQRNLFMYSFVSVVSLLIRLYSIGYCHGDLHEKNIVVYPTSSGMTTNHLGTKIYFTPAYYLIDTGFSYKHNQAVPTDLQTNIESFKRVIYDIITRRTKKIGYNMLNFPAYRWFPNVFIDDITEPQMLNEVRCQFIFTLFQHYNTYRETLEQHNLRIFTSSASGPEELENIRRQNHIISESVVGYIRSLQTHGNPLQLFNTYGGRSNTRSRSYHFTHKKTNKRRGSKFRHRKSTRRRK